MNSRLRFPQISPRRSLFARRPSLAIASLQQRCKFAPLFSTTSRMLLPQPFSFQTFALLPGGVYPMTQRHLKFYFNSPPRSSTLGVAPPEDSSASFRPFTANRKLPTSSSRPTACEQCSPSTGHGTRITSYFPSVDSTASLLLSAVGCRLSAFICNPCPSPTFRIALLLDVFRTRVCVPSERIWNDR